MEIGGENFVDQLGAGAPYRGRGIQGVVMGRIRVENDDITSFSTDYLDNIANAVKISITEQLVGDSPVHACCCIFRVPPLFRRQKMEENNPKIILIGPFHRKSQPFHRNPLSLRFDHEQFQFMENVKWCYLQSLIVSNLSSDFTLESLIKDIMKLIIRARQCYSEKFDNIDDVEFVKMMILDGCFLLELFRKTLLRSKGLFPDKNEDLVFNMHQYLYHDLLLLENQLPWFVLECLYDLTVDKASVCGASLPELVSHFFRLQVTDKSNRLLADGGVFHILDLIRTVMVASFNGSDHVQSEEKRDKEEQHDKEELTYFLQRIPNATTLSEAGIKFKKSEDTSTCIMNISFQNRVLTIPRLEIDETTGPLFRNLIAYEQCHYARAHKITSYAVLMDSLIDTSKDVDVLCEKGILVNWLSSEDAFKFFKELYNDTAVVGFYYMGLCNDVNKYYNTDWNSPKPTFREWMKNLKHDYFSTPWKVISWIAAFILLILTLLQTVYTMKQYYNHK